MNIKRVLAACHGEKVRRVREVELRKLFPVRQFDLMFWVNLIKDVGRKFFLATFSKSKKQVSKTPQSP